MLAAEKSRLLYLPFLSLSFSPSLCGSPWHPTCHHLCSSSLVVGRLISILIFSQHIWQAFNSICLLSLSEFPNTCKNIPKHEKFLLLLFFLHSEIFYTMFLETFPTASSISLRSLCCAWIIKQRTTRR